MLDPLELWVTLLRSSVPGRMEIEATLFPLLARVLVVLALVDVEVTTTGSTPDFRWRKLTFCNNLLSTIAFLRQRNAHCHKCRVLFPRSTLSLDV